jgi:hypothetical protein
MRQEGAEGGFTSSTNRFSSDITPPIPPTMPRPVAARSGQRRPASRADNHISVIGASHEPGFLPQKRGFRIIAQGSCAVCRRREIAAPRSRDWRRCRWPWRAGRLLRLLHPSWGVPSACQCLPFGMTGRRKRPALVFRRIRGRPQKSPVIFATSPAVRLLRVLACSRLMLHQQDAPDRYQSWRLSETI